VLLCRQVMPTDIISPEPDGTQLELSETFDPADWGVEGEPFTLTGHVDMTIRGHQDYEEPVDFKAVSIYTWNDMAAAAAKPDHIWWTKESAGYIAQVRWYMMMLRLSGRSDGQRGYLVAVNKNTGHLTEVMIARDDAAEKKLILGAVTVFAWINEAKDVFDSAYRDAQGIGSNDSEAIELGNTVAEQWIRDNIPRAQFTKGMIVDRPAPVKRPDGSKGPCKELQTNGKTADPQGFRCSYCAHTGRCWPEFGVVAMSTGPVWRTNS